MSVFSDPYWQILNDQMLDEMPKEKIIDLYKLIYATATDELGAVQKDKDKIIELQDYKLDNQRRTIEFYQKKVRELEAQNRFDLSKFNGSLLKKNSKTKSKKSAVKN
jgi:hypothetical protein